MQADVFDINKKKVGTVELPDDVFGAEVKEALMWEQVKAQLASRRRGTHKIKHRGEVSGGGAKPFKQKGTGQARQGSRRAPNFVGGGTVFGPVPRDYSYRLPRSARRAALKSVLSLRAKAGLIIVDKLPMEGPKTKKMVDVLAKLGAERALIVDMDNDNLKLSVRNIPRNKFVVADHVNVYDVLGHEQLILTQSAVASVVKRARRHDKVEATAS